MSNKTKTLLIAILCILGGPVLTYMGYQDKTRLEALDKGGVTVTGEIVGGHSERRRRGSSQTLVVEYKTADGKSASHDFSVSKDFYTAHTSGDTITDPAVQVRYLPSDPENAILVGGSTDRSMLLFVGVGVLLLGIGLAVYGMKRQD